MALESTRLEGDPSFLSLKDSNWTELHKAKLSGFKESSGRHITHSPDSKVKTHGPKPHTCVSRRTLHLRGHQLNKESHFVSLVK
jgi:hypothetical protein